MAGRLSVIPDERLAALRPLLDEQIEQAARAVCGEAFAEFFDATMQAAFCAGIADTGAHEGSVWLLDEPRTALVPRFNNGPNAAAFVDAFRQSLDSGLISTVVATEQPMCENSVARNDRQDRSLDRILQLRTQALLAVPFYFAGGLRGVLSAVKLSAANADCAPPPGFPADAIGALQFTAGVLGRLIERRLIGLVVGLEECG